MNETIVVAPGVVVLRPLYGPPWEQALAVNVEGYGLVVLVGCSHPGVVRIVGEAARETGVRPGLVIGGFHMFASPPSECRRVLEELNSTGIRNLAPIHCSGDTLRELAQRLLPGKYVDVHVGTVLLVDSSGVHVVEDSPNTPDAGNP